MKKQIVRTLEAHLNNLYDRPDRDSVRDEIRNTEEQIIYLYDEIRKEANAEYIRKLRDFREHMTTSYDVLMGDYGDDKTCETFYTSTFAITWRGKTVELENGATVFQGIEELIDTEIDENEV